MTSYEVVQGSEAGGETLQATRALARVVQAVEHLLMRYGLALILLWIGAMKFTAYEANGIRGLEANSPFMGHSWLHWDPGTLKLYRSG